MKKLSSDHLRKLILEEIARMNEEKEIDSIINKVLDEHHDQWARDDYGHSAALKRDAEYDRHHGHSDWAKDDEDHIGRLKGDAHYDKEDELSWMRHHGMEESNCGTNESHCNEETLEEYTDIQDVGDSDTSGLDSTQQMVAAIAPEEEAWQAGPGNIGENTQHLSRGALYRRRYYGRY